VATLLFTQLYTGWVTTHYISKRESEREREKKKRRMRKGCRRKGVWPIYSINNNIEEGTIQRHNTP
jgi:hypothetical protein